MDHYEMLGVPRDATADEIRHAYLSKEQQLDERRYDGAPPEVMTAVSQARTMVEEAESVLGDPARRAEYDEHLDAEAAAPKNEPMAPAPGGLEGAPMVPSEELFMSPLADALAPLEQFANWIGPGGHRSKTVVVPDVRGMKASRAFYEVARADLHMKFVRLTANPAGVDGTCVDQDPAPGTSARRHSTVVVQVWHPTAGSETTPF